MKRLMPIARATLALGVAVDELGRAIAVASCGSAQAALLAGLMFMANSPVTSFLSYRQPDFIPPCRIATQGLVPGGFRAT